VSQNLRDRLKYIGAALMLMFATTVFMTQVPWVRDFTHDISGPRYRVLPKVAVRKAPLRPVAADIGNGAPRAPQIRYVQVPSYRVAPRTAVRETPDFARDCPPVEPVVLASGEPVFPFAEQLTAPVFDVGTDIIRREITTAMRDIDRGEPASFGPIGGGGGNPPPPPPPPPPLPEPITWLFYILGFGMLGVMVRLARRKRSVAAAG